MLDDGLPLSASLVGNRSCAQCPEGTWAEPSGYSCVECGVDDCQDCSPVSLSNLPQTSLSILFLCYLLTL